MSYTDKLVMPRGECKLKVAVDEALCIGIGSCQAWAPEHFELSEHRVAVVVNAAAADEETIIQAAMACPVEAITVESEAGERLWPLY